MWNEFKNKFKSLFDSEEEVKPRPKSNGEKANRYESNANTKMTYKYPKAGNFRFPVIPDTSKENENEKPVYNTRSKKKDQDKHKERTFSQDKEVKKPSSLPKPKLPTTSSTPFTPSDVPSPVYGYNPKTEPIVKEEDSEYKEQNTNDAPLPLNIEQSRIDDAQWEKIRKRMRGKIDSGKERERRRLSAEQQSTENTQQQEPKQDEHMQELASAEEDVQAIEKPKKTEAAPISKGNKDGAEGKETEDTRPISKPEAAKSPPRSSTQRSRVPFNVVMTPRDKRTRDQQKKTPQKENNDQQQKKTPEVTSMAELNNTEESVRKEYSTPLYLLNDPVEQSTNDQAWIEQQMERLETTLRQFHVKAKVVHAMKGPAVTRFEVQPEPGVKVSKITNLSDDIKLSMAARDIRIEAPIPGKQAVGIEVPNQQAEMVGLQKIFESDDFKNDSSPLSVALGLDIGGDAVVTNLKKMPHGLIAGATGSGKSVCINTILISLLYKAHHDDVKFLLIDPKMVELAPYNSLPHLVSPVITDVKAATTALKWAVKEMEERYQKFVDEGVRDVERYNEKVLKQGRRSDKLPYLVIVIDELADLMMVSPQDVEDSICRIAQKARACGIHLLLATQRPSVDVITGLIKANIPTRIAFSVSSQVDSRTIIDSGGAEKLLGRGDMLFIENGSGQSVRIQGAFVSDDEIERITGHVKKIAPPNYLFEQEELIKQLSSEEETDILFEEAVQFVIDHNGASASLLQRRFKVGYNRAARLIDQMEDYGIISEQKGSKPRDILLNKQQVADLMSTMA
ncbi:DNA translocase FtsK [Halobacillus shinanisalinarum]|uniref:DNA translocase FtsK n=1 Tax=Halobacillus shinanisalinarum TaxID=2932258 RepID=A0ABY4H5C5_9BACI|nr:DNA translocase FtsK [Halobacillus shinanisalinarum]UOQ94162.1 DNA translocase FtsK [Halobacillus shinanisalinarum]